MESVFVHCTLTNGTAYTIYEPLTDDDDNKSIRRVSKVIRVRGGANRMNRGLWTPEGEVTEISKSDLELLRSQCPLFNFHEKHGYIKVKDLHRLDNRDMEKRDESGQLTPEIQKKRGRKSPRTKREIESSSDGDDE